MCKTIGFIISNSKNIVFLICSFATVIAFCVTLYGIPTRVEADEREILLIKQRQDIFEVRFMNLEQSFKDIKEDMKEIKADVKLLLQRG